MNKREREAHEAYQQQQFFGEELKSINKVREDAKLEPLADTRYNVPKAAPKTSGELVEKTIVNTEIYRQARIAVLQSYITAEAKSVILDVQRKQVAYGLDKYPEPLNPNTWSITETIDHILDESIDRLHYLIMLRIKLEQLIAEMVYTDEDDVLNTNERIDAINRMIDKAIEELQFLAMIRNRTDRTTTKKRNDNMDATIYGLKYMQKNLPDHGCCNLGDIKLSMSGADLDGDEALVEYAKADVEATHAFYTSSDQDDLNKGE